MKFNMTGVIADRGVPSLLVDAKLKADGKLRFFVINGAWDGVLLDNTRIKVKQFPNDEPIKGDFEFVEVPANIKGTNEAFEWYTNVHKSQNKENSCK